VFEEKGCDAVAAVDGAEGLQWYQAEPATLVMNDLSMPVLDGLEGRRVMPTSVLMAISGDKEVLTQVRGLTPYTSAKPLQLGQVLIAVHALVATRPQISGPQAWSCVQPGLVTLQL